MNEIDYNENNNINNYNNKKVKPIIKCIYCEKLETQFRHSKIRKSNKTTKNNNSLIIQTINEKTIIKEKEREKEKENNSNNNNDNNIKLFRKSKYSIESKDKENKDNHIKKIKKLQKVKKSISTANIKSEDKKTEENKIGIKKNEEQKGNNKDNEEEKRSKNVKKKTKLKSSKKLKKIKKSSEKEESPDNSGVEAEPNSSEESEVEEEVEEEEEKGESSGKEESSGKGEQKEEDSGKEENIKNEEEKNKNEKSDEENKNEKMIEENILNEKRHEEKEESENNEKNEENENEEKKVKEENEKIEEPAVKEEKKIKVENEPEVEPEYEEDQNISSLPVMLTNLNSTDFDIYHKYFDICGHAICYNCIARLTFTSYLNELPVNESVKILCKCNKGSTQISINELDKISEKLNLPDEEKICDKHGLVQIKFCKECKKNLCKKCIESHEDLFGQNLHHLEDESPPHTDLCKDHPTCFLDTLCTDCHKIICHQCIVEGNKHYCHNSMSFNSMRLNIIKNVENMKYHSFDLFQKGVDDLNNAYENLYNEEIKIFTEQINNLIENINEYREKFLNQMKIKLEQKNQIIHIIKNIYEFFFKEYVRIPKSVDYPVLCLYQVFNCDFISFRIDIPEMKNPFINKIIDNISSIDNSDSFFNKYQFSLKNYAQSQSIINHSDAINSICCLPDGRLVTGGEDKKVLIWAKTFDKIDFALLDNPKPVKLVKILNDGRLIVGGFQTLKIYNNNNNFKVSCILKDISNNVTDLINLDDGRIVCGSYREMKVFNMTWNSLYKDGKSIKEHSSWVNSLIKLNGKRFASGSEDKQILIFDYNMKIIRRIQTKFSVSILCNKINNDIIYDDENYNNFYIGDYDGRIYLYKFSTQNLITVSELDEHNSKINAIIPLFGGNYCSIAQESKIIIHDGEFKPIQTIYNNDNNKSVNSVIQLFDGKIITGNQIGGINIYE